MSVSLPGRGLTRAGGRPALLAAAVMLLVPVGPSAAEAASVGTPDAAYYRSVVTGLEPAVDGVEVTVRGGGESITLANRSGREVVVLGYAGEPYLRFTADGVAVNDASLSEQVNAGRPPTAQPGRPAVSWKLLAHEQRYTWRDYRVRWTTQERPPVVAADEHSAHRVFDWGLPLTVGGRQVLVRGAVEWTGIPAADPPRFLPGGPLIPGLALAALVAAALVADRMLRRRRPTVPPSSAVGPRSGRR